MQWTEKYAPKHLSDIAGNPSAIKDIERWAKTWKPGQKPLLLYGPPGTGKTATAIALARTMDWQILEMNASDIRNKEAIERRAGIASSSSTLSGKTRMILFDEVDGMFSQDRGGITAISHILKEASCPIVLTANDLYARPIYSIRALCIPIKFKRVHYQTIAHILSSILKKEGIEFDNDVVVEIAKEQHGDIKAAINDLQAVAEGKKRITKKDLTVLGSRDRKQDIINAMKTIFKTNQFSEARKVYSSVEEDPELFLNWIDENIPREYTHPDDLYKAFSIMSRADIYRARIIRRQNWSLLRYVLDLITAGIALSKKETYKTFVPYQFPSFIKKLSASKSRRKIRDSIANKFGEKCHTSTSETITIYIPFLKQMFSDDKYAVQYAAVFDFDIDEVQYLKGCSPDKAKKIVGEAEKLKTKIVVQKLKHPGQMTLSKL
ncbi:MAG: replication factor C large subunit [Candidatus Diapherotrites archaeon]|nr:replication factor C large subunit [Candidatus Diapherotrites archaeon]